MLNVLRQRNFRLLWSAGFISLLGDWILYTVFPFYIALSTGSALATGAMAATDILPGLLFGSLAGVFADRWNRKKTMIAADLLRALVLLLLFTVQSSHFLWIVYLVAFTEASISTFFGPAKVALLLQIVNEQDLISANALSGISDNICRLVGPALAGGLFFFFGLKSLVLLDCLSYLLSALLILNILVLPGSNVVKSDREQRVLTKMVWLTFWQQWFRGFRVVSQEGWLLALFTGMAIAMMGQGIVNALLTIFAEQIVRMNAQTYGWFISLQGIGGLIGGLIIGKLGKVLDPVRSIGLSIIIAGMLLILIVNVPLISVSFVCMTLVGACVIVWVVSLQTFLQQRVNKSFVGRVIGTYMTTQTLFLLLGTVGGTLLGGAIGIVPILTLGGGLFLAAGVGSWISLGSFLKHDKKEATAVQAFTGQEEANEKEMK